MPFSPPPIHLPHQLALPRAFWQECWCGSGYSFPSLQCKNYSSRLVSNLTFSAPELRKIYVYLILSFRSHFSIQSAKTSTWKNVSKFLLKPWYAGCIASFRAINWISLWKWKREFKYFIVSPCCAILEINPSFLDMQKSRIL